jgi:DNA primase
MPPDGLAPARRTAPARPPQPAAGQRAQDLLLQLLLTEADLRRRVAAEGVEAYFSDADRGAVATRILGVAGAAEKFDPGPLFDLLDEEQKAILSGILVKDGEIFAGEEEQIFADCRQAVERERLRRRSRELTALIGEAAAAGDMERLAAYNKEKSEIKRQLTAAATATDKTVQTPPPRDESREEKS